MNHPSAGNWEGDSYNWDRKKQTKTNKKYDQNIYDEIKRYAAYIWDFIVTYFNDFKSEKYTRLWFEKYQSYIWDIFIKGSQNITKFGQYVYNEFPRCSTYIWEFIVKYFDEFRSGTSLVRKILAIHLGYAKNDQFWTIYLQRVHEMFVVHLEFHSPSYSICLGYHCPRSSNGCF